MLRGSPHILPGLRWSRQALLLTACTCVLFCEPSWGWWGAGGAPESGAVETWQAAKAKEIAAWKICNDTNASAVDAIAKASSLHEAATAAQQSVANAEKGGFFGATSPEELQRLQLAAQEARTSAAKAQETADILSGTASLARKRAQMANELVATLQQTVEISENITSWNVQVVNLGNGVQSAEARYAEVTAIARNIAEDVIKLRQVSDGSQNDLDEVQKRLSNASMEESQKLIDGQTILFEKARKDRKAFADAVQESTDAQEKMSMLAMEVSTLKNRLLEAQHKMTVMEKELKRTQELEEQLKRTQEPEEQAQSYLETKLTQVLSDKSALEEKMRNVTSELLRLNEAYSSEKETLTRLNESYSSEKKNLTQVLSDKSALEEKMLNVTSELLRLNESYSSEKETFKNLTQVLSEKSALEEKMRNVTSELLRLNESYSSEKETLEKQIFNITSQLLQRQSLNDSSATCNAKDQIRLLQVEKELNESLANKTQLLEDIEMLNRTSIEQQLLVDKVLSESIANETKLLKEIEMLNLSYATEKELLLEASRAINETLNTLKQNQLSETLRQEMAGLWKTAIDTEDAAKKAMQDALDAGAAAEAADTRAREAEPAFYVGWFTSSESLAKVKNLKEQAIDANKKFVAAQGTARALLRLHEDHTRIVKNLTAELKLSSRREATLKGWVHLYEQYAPPAMIDPKRMLSNLRKNMVIFFVNTYRTSLFLVLFMGMAGVYLSQLCSAPAFLQRFIGMIGIDFHVLYGLYVAFWLGNAGWSLGSMMFCAWIFCSTIGYKRVRRIKAASSMAHRLPLRECDDRVEVGFDVEIHVMHGLMDKSFDTIGKGDPYVTVKCGGQVRKTEFMRNTLTPKWDQKLEFEDIKEATEKVVFLVLDHDVVGKDDEIGFTQVNLSDIFEMCRDGERSKPCTYFITKTEGAMPQGSITVSWKWRIRAALNVKKAVKKSNERKMQPAWLGVRNPKERTKYQFDPYWGVCKEAEDLCWFFDKYVPGVTTQAAGIYKALRSYNINPNSIHTSLFSVVAYFCGRTGLDVAYLIPLAMGMHKAEGALSAALCREAWEKHTDVLKPDIRTLALHLWQEVFITSENRLNKSQLWELFQNVREDYSYWLRESETAWLNNLLGMFWAQYDNWISAYVANLVKSLVPPIVTVEDVRAGSGWPKLLKTRGAIAHPKDFPKNKDKIVVTIISASGLKGVRKASEMLRGDFESSVDPYITCVLKGWQENMSKKWKKKTKTKNNDLNPSWYEEFEFDLPKSGEGDTLHFKVMDDDVGMDEELAFLDVDSNHIKEQLANVPSGVLETEYSVDSKSKSKGIKLKLKWRMITGTPYLPSAGSNRMFTLDTDVVWDTDLAVIIKAFGIQIEVDIVSLRLPFRITLEWANYDSNMRRVPSMSACGNDFHEFRQQWQEWNDNAMWPQPVRLWLDLRSRPTLDTKINTALGDVFNIPGLGLLKEDVIPQIIYDQFPRQILLGDPAPISEHKKPTSASAKFVDFMDPIKSGFHRKATLRLKFLRADADTNIPIKDSNYYCVVRYGRRLQLKPPFDPELFLNGNEQQLRFSSTQWRGHHAIFDGRKGCWLDVNHPNDEMVVFEMYRICSKSRTTLQNDRLGDTLVFERKFTLKELIDNYGIIIYPRNGNDSNKKSLRRKLDITDGATLGLKWKEAGCEKPSQGTEIKNELLSAALQKKDDFKKEEWEKFQIANLSIDSYIKAGNRYFKPAATKLTVIAQLFTRGTDADRHSDALEGGAEAVGISLEQSTFGSLQGKEGAGGPGTLLLQLSAPKDTMPIDFFKSREFRVTLSSNDKKVDTMKFDGSDPSSREYYAHGTIGPVFRFEIPESSCSYSLEVTDTEYQKSVKMPVCKMKRHGDGFFVNRPADWFVSNEGGAPFPVILSSFLPYDSSIPTMLLTIHNIQNLPCYTGEDPPDAFCRVVVRKERRNALPEGVGKTTSEPVHYKTYEEYLRDRETVFPLYDGGEEQAKGLTTSRLQGKLDGVVKETFTLGFGPHMLQQENQFHQIVYVEVLQIDNLGNTTIVGTWEKSIRNLYREFFEKRSKISDEEVAKLGGNITGSTGEQYFTLTREMAPWTCISMEFEFQGPWLQVPEAYDMWWIKQEQVARLERGQLEAEATKMLWEESVKEAVEWKKNMERAKEKAGEAE